MTTGIVLLWIIGTLIALTGVAILAKKGGPEYVIGIFAALYVAGNILANKIVQFGPFTTAGGIIVFSLTFYLTDMLSELYGKKYAQKAVWVGLCAQIIVIVSIWIAIAWQPAGFWSNQEAYATTLSNTWRIALASLTAYIISQHWDIMVYHLLKRKTKNKYLWLRNNCSTISSQAIDSVLFSFLAFYGVLELPAIWGIVLGSFVIKTIIAVFDTPFLYVVRWYFVGDRKQRGIKHGTSKRLS